MARRRRMTAKQRKYFGKRRTHKVYAARVHKRRYVSMAKYRQHRSGGRSRGIGGIKGMLPAVLGGLGDSIIDPMLPIDGIGGTAVGFFMHNNTVRDIGLYKVGYSLGGVLPIGNLLGGITGGSKGGNFA